MLAGVHALAWLAATAVLAAASPVEVALGGSSLRIDVAIEVRTVAGGTESPALAWATPPTSPAYFYRRATLGLVSDELLWTWPSGGGLLLLPATSLVLWLFATGSVLDGWFTLEQ